MNKYKLTYSIDITGWYINEVDYNFAYKRVHRLIASLPERIWGGSKNFGIDIPEYDPDKDCILTFTFLLDDFDCLQEMLKLLKAYCILNYTEDDPSPIIETISES